MLDLLPPPPVSSIYLPLNLLCPLCQAAFGAFSALMPLSRKGGGGIATISLMDRQKATEGMGWIISSGIHHTSCMKP